MYQKKRNRRKRKVLRGKKYGKWKIKRKEERKGERINLVI
jgi:hypothetical protein